MEVVCRCCYIPKGERQHSGGDCRVLGIRKVDLCFELVLPTNSEEEAFCEQRPGPSAKDGAVRLTVYGHLKKDLAFLC